MFSLLPADMIKFQEREQPFVQTFEFGGRSRVDSAPNSWPVSRSTSESSAKAGSTYRRPWETQWQPKKAAFSVGCPTHEVRRGCEQRETKAAKGSSAYMEQMSPKLLQKNASFSAGMEPQWQPKKAAFLVGSNKEHKKGISQLDQEKRSVVHESNKDFGQILREQLQEFAMILTKKYHYNFPVEYFDDYHGSFNKEEFLGMKQQEEKLKERANKEARSIDHFMEEVEEQQQLKVEGLDNVEGFLSNDKKETAPAEGRLADPKQCHHIAANFGDDIGDGLHPSKGTCNEQIDRAANAEGSFDIAEKEVQIEGNCSQQKGKDVADWEEKNVESLAGIKVATAPNPTAYRQPWSENPRQVYYSLLLHFQDDVDEFAAELGCGVNEEVNDRILRLEADAALFALVQSVVKTCGFVPVEYLRKKKKPRRRKREKEVKQKMKVGVG